MLNLTECKRYSSVIKDSKNVVIYFYIVKADAEKKSKSLKSPLTKTIVRARDEKGRFQKGFVLICCK